MDSCYQNLKIKRASLRCSVRVSTNPKLLKKYGEAQVKVWRRSFDVQQPRS